MVVSICIGSSCHLKGSRDIVTKLTELISEHKLQEQVELTGAFCMGNCVKGVCVKVDDELYSVTPTSTEEFFQHTILRRLNQ